MSNNDHYLQNQYEQRRPLTYKRNIMVEMLCWFFISFHPPSFHLTPTLMALLPSLFLAEKIIVSLILLGIHNNHFFLFWHQSHNQIKIFSDLRLSWLVDFSK